MAALHAPKRARARQDTHPPPTPPPPPPPPPPPASAQPPVPMPRSDPVPSATAPAPPAARGPHPHVAPPTPLRRTSSQTSPLRASTNGVPPPFTAQHRKSGRSTADHPPRAGSWAVPTVPLSAERPPDNDASVADLTNSPDRNCTGSAGRRPGSRISSQSLTTAKPPFRETVPTSPSLANKAYRQPPSARTRATTVSAAANHNRNGLRVPSPLAAGTHSGHGDGQRAGEAAMCGVAWDIWTRCIFSRLDPRSLRAAAAVCSAWYRTTASEASLAPRYAALPPGPSDAHACLLALLHRPRFAHVQTVDLSSCSATTRDLLLAVLADAYLPSSIAAPRANPTPFSPSLSAPSPPGMLSRLTSLSLTLPDPVFAPSRETSRCLRVVLAGLASLHLSFPAPISAFRLPDSPLPSLCPALKSLHLSGALPLALLRQSCRFERLRHLTVAMTIEHLDGDYVDALMNLLSSVGPSLQSLTLLGLPTPIAALSVHTVALHPSPPALTSLTIDSSLGFLTSLPSAFPHLTALRCVTPAPHHHLPDSSPMPVLLGSHHVSSMWWLYPLHDLGNLLPVHPASLHHLVVLSPATPLPSQVCPRLSSHWSCLRSITLSRAPLASRPWLSVFLLRQLLNYCTSLQHLLAHHCRLEVPLPPSFPPHYAARSLSSTSLLSLSFPGCAFETGDGAMSDVGRPTAVHFVCALARASPNLRLVVLDEGLAWCGARQPCEPHPTLGAAAEMHIPDTWLPVFCPDASHPTPPASTPLVRVARRLASLVSAPATCTPPWPLPPRVALRTSDAVRSHVRRGDAPVTEALGSFGVTLTASDVSAYCALNLL